MLVLHWKQDAYCLLLQLEVIIWGALLATPQIPADHKATLQECQLFYNA